MLMTLGKGGQSTNGNRVLISKMRKIRFVKGDIKLCLIATTLMFTIVLS